ADILRVLDEFLNGQLTNDTAQVAFHHQANQVLAFTLALAQELLGSRCDALLIRAHFDLGDGLDINGNTLCSVQVLGWGYVEGHQLQRKFLRTLVEGDHKVRTTSDNLCPASTIDNQCLVGSNLT